MTSRNEHTGDMLMSKRNSKEYEQNYSKIFGDKKPAKRGRFIWDSNKQELVPANQYERPKEKRSNLPTPMFSFFQPGRSPITGEWLETKSAMIEDMKRHGCREYEGFESEQRAAEEYQKDQEKAFEASLSDCVERTANDLKYNMTEKADSSKPLNIFND